MNKLREQRWGNEPCKIYSSEDADEEIENVTKRPNYFAELDKKNETEGKYLSAFFWFVCIGIPTGLILSKCGLDI